MKRKIFKVVGILLIAFTITLSTSMVSEVVGYSDSWPNEFLSHFYIDNTDYDEDPDVQTLCSGVGTISERQSGLPIHYRYTEIRPDDCEDDFIYPVIFMIDLLFFASILYAILIINKKRHHHST